MKTLAFLLPLLSSLAFAIITLDSPVVTEEELAFLTLTNVVRVNPAAFYAIMTQIYASLNLAPWKVLIY